MFLLNKEIRAKELSKNGNLKTLFGAKTIGS